jgi:hypothetical protein
VRAEAVVGALADQDPRDVLAGCNAVFFRLTVLDRAEGLVVGRVEDRRLLARQVVHEDRVRRGDDRGLGRSAPRRVDVDHERSVAALDCGHGVVDADSDVRGDHSAVGRRQRRRGEGLAGNASQ